jgi:hypothetical protein
MGPGTPTAGLPLAPLLLALAFGLLFVEMAVAVLGLLSLSAGSLRAVHAVKAWRVQTRIAILSFIFSSLFCGKY